MGAAAAWRAERARGITYQAAPGEHVVVKGSEPVTGWEREPGGGTAGTVWRIQLWLTSDLRSVLIQVWASNQVV